MKLWLNFVYGFRQTELLPTENCEDHMTQSTGDPTWLLAIDTSTGQAGLALTDGVAFAEISWVAGRNQTVSVLTQVDALLSLAGIESSAIRAVAVAIGPGMFNGLRIGMSLAKGFHLGQDAALIGVSTLEVSARQFGGLGHTVLATVAAGRDRLVWQSVPGDADPVNGDVQALRAIVENCLETVIVCGDLSIEQAAELTTLPNVIIPPASSRSRRATVLAEIGWERFVRGEIDDPITLSPVYVHSSGVPARS